METHHQASSDILTESVNHQKELMDLQTQYLNNVWQEYQNQNKLIEDMISEHQKALEAQNRIASLQREECQGMIQDIKQSYEISSNEPIRMVSYQEQILAELGHGHRQQD